MNVLRGMGSRQRSLLGLLVVSIAMVLGTPDAIAQDDRMGIAVKEPRAYGHVVGDRIRRSVRFDLPTGYQLERASLPGEGDLEYWLDLASVDVDRQTQRGGRVVVTLDYQLFYAPLQASQRELPGFTVQASNTANERIEARIPGFVFTMSPIIELQPEAKFGDEENNLVLPDERPALRNTVAPRNASLAALGAILLALLSWAWAADRIPGRERGPFARALARIRSLRKADDNNAVPEALRAIHRAFDTTAGRSVFAEDVARFVATYPAFADRRDEIEIFFDFSRRFFFGSEAIDCSRGHTLDELTHLARECRRREIRA